MGKQHRMIRRVEADPEWFLAGVPLPPNLAGKREKQRAKAFANGQALRDKGASGANRKYVRKVLQEMAYEDEEE